MRRSELAAAAVLLLVGLFTIAQSRTLSYWYQQAPGPGFVPFWLGVLLTGVAALILVTPAGASGAATRLGATGKPVALTVFAAGALLLSPLAGMPTACGLFMAAALFLVEPRRWIRNIVVAAATTASVSLLFVHGLGVPLPLGPFGF